MDRFKSNPYNPRNRLIIEEDLIKIFDSLDMSVKISDISLYQKSFVHKSYTHLKDYEEYEEDPSCLPLCDDSYETMEFLGDSLVGSVISSYLYERYVHNFKVDEGFLTKLKIRFVCGDQLGYVSNSLGFSEFMIISKHIDDNCEGRQNTHILEDTFESFVGALFLDTQDLDLVKQFILRTMETHVDIADLILKDNNYKDQILRYFQHNFKIHPTYETNKIELHESSLFECKIYKGDELIQIGSGTTKKRAEQEASRKALQLFHVIS